MKNEQSVLQIKKGTATLLSAIDIEEEISLINKFEIIRNLSNEPLTKEKPCIKYKYIVKTNYPPDISLLKIGDFFDVYTTIHFREKANTTTQIEKAKETIEVEDGFSIFRPIFQMILKNYTVSNTGSFKWALEFEQA